MRADSEGKSSQRFGEREKKFGKFLNEQRGLCDVCVWFWIFVCTEAIGMPAISMARAYDSSHDLSWTIASNLIFVRLMFGVDFNLASNERGYREWVIRRGNLRPDVLVLFNTLKPNKLDHRIRPPSLVWPDFLLFWSICANRIQFQLRMHCFD